MLRKQLCATAVAVILTVPACAMRKPGEAIKPGFNLFSKEQDVQLGQQAAQQVRQQYPIVDNRELQSYVERIGNKLARQPLADQYPYQFGLVNDKNINAFALPGGPVFIHTGLLLAADNEAQVAGVIAHEIAHVALRHGTNQASKANLMQLPAILAGAVTGSNLLAQITNLGAMGFMMKFSRSAESQADALGARLMANASYNPVEMARFFEKLEAEGGSRAPQFLSDHPNPGNRIKAVQDEIQSFPQQSYNSGASGEFSRAKALAAQLPAGRTAGRSIRSNNDAPSQAPVIQPSRGFRQLKGKAFALSYPDNWEAFGDNNSAMVTIAPREGIVQGNRGGSAVGYGAIVSYYFPEDQQRRTNLADATNELIHHLHSSNPSMQVASRNAKRLRIDGSQAMLTQLASESPFGGQTETDMLLTVERPEGLFYMIFIAPERQFRELQATFDEMVKSIRFSN